MYERCRFQPDHVRGLKLQAGQTDDQKMPEFLDPAHWRLLASTPYSWTGLRDGRPFCCGGVIEQWKGRAQAWFLFAHDASRYDLLFATREMQAILFALDRAGIFTRIEATVRTDFAAGHRWAKMFGMKAEGVMQKYDQWGFDHVLYARVI